MFLIAEDVNDEGLADPHLFLFFVSTKKDFIICKFFMRRESGGMDLWVK